MSGASGRGKSGAGVPQSKTRSAGRIQREFLRPGRPRSGEVVKSGCLTSREGRPKNGLRSAVFELFRGMDVSVVIVTYNSAGCIQACIGSVLRQQRIAAEVIVVDNASSDGTAEVVGSLGPQVQVMANRDNVGFGRACNQGFKAGRGQFVFLLNPDAQLDGVDALARLKQALDAHPRWGMAGTRLLDEHGNIESLGETTYPDQDRARCDFSHLPGSLAWISGASMFIRRQAFEGVEGFDPGFFLTSEETDLCLRVRQQGWEIGLVPEVTVRHIGMASERGSDPYDTWLRRMPGIIRFWSKHYPADDVGRLVRRDLLRANFRRGWHGVIGWFCGPESEAWRKHRRYAGISEASRRFLQDGR